MRLGEADCVFCSTFWLFINQERSKCPFYFSNHLQLLMHSSVLIRSGHIKTGTMFSVVVIGVLISNKCKHTALRTPFQ